MRHFAVGWILASSLPACLGEAPPIAGSGSADGSDTASSASTGRTSTSAASEPTGGVLTSAGAEAESRGGSLDGESGPDGSSGGGACLDPPPDLVALWRFDGDAIDDVAGIELVPHGAPMYGEGRLDGAVVLDGVDTWLETDTQAPVVGSAGTPFSIEAWVWLEALDRPVEAQFDDLNLVGRMLPGNMPNGDGWRVFVAPDDRWALCLGRDNNGCQPGVAFVGAADIAAVQTWTHVVAVSTTGSIHLFVDGVAFDAVAEGTISGAGPLVVGASTSELSTDPGYLYEALFYGRVDELAIYDRALTPEEVVDLFMAPLPKCVP